MTLRRSLVGERINKPSAAQIKRKIKQSQTVDDFQMKPGYIYTVVRAISARINQNYDGWPADELKKSYHTFVGKPVFVNHENYDPKEARGVVVASRYIENGNDKYIEVVQEIDAQRFPKLAHEIRTGGLDSVSMGAEAAFTICSYCSHKATDETDMCDHVKYHKGEKLAKFNRRTGKTDDILVYESCHKLSFFELSYVFEPADETAVASKVLVAGRDIGTGPSYQGPSRPRWQKSPRNKSTVDTKSRWLAEPETGEGDGLEEEIDPFDPRSYQAAVLKTAGMTEAVLHALPDRPGRHSRPPDADPRRPPEGFPVFDPAEWLLLHPEDGEGSVPVSHRASLIDPRQFGAAVFKAAGISDVPDDSGVPLWMHDPEFWNGMDEKAQREHGPFADRGLGSEYFVPQNSELNPLADTDTDAALGSSRAYRRDVSKRPHNFTDDWEQSESLDPIHRLNSFEERVAAAALNDCLPGAPCDKAPGLDIEKMPVGTGSSTPTALSEGTGTATGTPAGPGSSAGPSDATGGAPGKPGADGLLDNNRQLYNDLMTQFPGSDIGKYRVDDYHEHDHGALDFMTKDPDQAAAVRQKAFDEGAPYVLWQQQQWNSDGSVSKMDDRHSPTQNHMDHVHIAPFTPKPMPTTITTSFQKKVLRMAGYKNASQPTMGVGEWMQHRFKGRPPSDDEWDRAYHEYHNEWSADPRNQVSGGIDAEQPPILTHPHLYASFEDRVLHTAGMRRQADDNAQHGTNEIFTGPNAAANAAIPAPLDMQKITDAPGVVNAPNANIPWEEGIGDIATPDLNATSLASPAESFTGPNAAANAAIPWEEDIGNISTPQDIGTPHLSPGGPASPGPGNALTTASFERQVLRLAFGETEAPDSVDTLREEGSAPEDESDDFHHYVEPPDGLRDPDLTQAGQIDREQGPEQEQGVGGPDANPEDNSADAQNYMVLKIPMPGVAPPGPMQPPPQPGGQMPPQIPAPPQGQPPGIPMQNFASKVLRAAGYRLAETEEERRQREDQPRNDPNVPNAPGKPELNPGAPPVPAGTKGTLTGPGQAAPAAPAAPVGQNGAPLEDWQLPGGTNPTDKSGPGGKGLAMPLAESQIGVYSPTLQHNVTTEDVTGKANQGSIDAWNKANPTNVFDPEMKYDTSTMEKGVQNLFTKPGDPAAAPATPDIPATPTPAAPDALPAAPAPAAQTPGTPQQNIASRALLGGVNQYLGINADPTTLENSRGVSQTSRKPRKGQTMGRSRANLAQRGKVASRGQRQHFAEGPNTDGGPYGRNDEGEQEDVFLTPVPPAEHVEMPDDDTPNISNTKENLVARVQQGRAQLLRDAKALAAYQAGQGSRRQAGDDQGSVVNPSVQDSASEALTGDNFEALGEEPVRTDPKQAALQAENSLRAFQAFDQWLHQATGRQARSHTARNIRIAADEWAKRANADVRVLFPALGIVLRQARKIEAAQSKGAKMRKRADEKLEVAAPDARVDVEAPVDNVTDEEAQESQFDLTDFADNAGDDLADPDLSTDSQFWAPGEGSKKSSHKTQAKKPAPAGGILAVRAAEAYINAGLEPNTRERKYQLAGLFENMNRGTVQRDIALLERVAQNQSQSRQKVASGRTRGAASLPPGLTQSGTRRSAAVQRTAANDPINDALLFD